MRNFIIALLLLLPFALQATEKQRSEGELPLNMHEFTWQAETNDGKIFAGKGIDNELRGALVYTRHQLNKLARDGSVEDGTEFTITLRWKGVDFIRGGIGRKSYPEAKRGSKQGEIDRGPNGHETPRKNSDADLRMVEDPKLIRSELIVDKLPTTQLERGPNKAKELPRGPRRN